MGGKKKYMIGLIVIVLSLSAIIYFTFQFGLTEIGEDCIVISENEGDNKIEIVFLTDDVKKSEVDTYLDLLLNSDPFSDHKEKFNFYYAGDADCKLLEGNLFCYSRDLLKKSSICPNDYIIVLSNEDPSIRSSAYTNVISLNINHKKNAVLHEFGHTFGNLADEYVPSIVPSGSKNCVQECEEFTKYGELEGCYRGCSESEYFRSSESSVMRTLKTNDFNELNSLLMEGYLGKYE